MMALTLGLSVAALLVLGALWLEAQQPSWPQAEDDDEVSS